MRHTCSFNGRLGNNLFQIATTIALAKQAGVSFYFPHTTWAGHRGHLPVDLSMFAYPFEREDSPELEEQYNEAAFEYVTIPLERASKIAGFFQSWQYFESIREELLTKYFTPSQVVQEKLNEYTVSPNALGISVRRGDYLMLQNNHCVLTADYYQEAINKYFQSGVDSIYVFSDDPTWCRQVFGPDVHYVQDTVGTQLFLMTEMKHLILSNSTFAWWGAYLNQNQGTIVAPTPWFGPANADKDTSGLYYPSWQKLEHEIVRQPYSITPNMYQ
jgi:hypothetical protein